MPCLGGRKKKKGSIHQVGNNSEKSRQLGNDSAVVQMKQEYHELKSKNEEHLDVIARQSAELAHLRQKLDSTNNKSDINTESIVAEMEARNKETLSSLQQKEALLQQKEKEIEQLLMKAKEEEGLETILAEKNELLQSKEEQIQSLQLKWQAERAELVKPALEEVSLQLEQLKKTNEDVQKRLADKEGELAELRTELTRRERTSSNRGKSNDVQERQKRLNRLTVDLENDRLMIQKLEELNQQLEAQKKQHEAVLQTHAQAIAEKDRELIEHQQSLSEIKSSHQQAIRTLERNQQSSMAELKSRHEKDLAQLKQRLGLAEKRAKSDMNDEVEKLLREFEQSEHDHTQQMAHLQKSHREQLTVMKKDQQAEIRHHIQKRNSIILLNNNSNNDQMNELAMNPLPNMNINNQTNTTPTPLRKTGGPAGKVLRWPTMSTFHDQPELMPKDPHAIHVYISSVSANSTVKRNQETIQTLLTTSQIQYQVIDVARREPALQHMRKQTNGRSIQLPLIFVGGHYRGQLEDLVQAQDSQTLSDFLSLPTDNNNNNSNNNNNNNNNKSTNQQQGSNSTTSSTASTPVTTPTASRAPSTLKQPSDYNDDAFLLQELEKELASSQALTTDL
ncbi:uncharacterized protein BX664DRAFT_355928 [Halteromyces radiatus]|uniref:uncharacterized protein n=1 Tax=Halteromyces radiatus TaxID=101107 RepID=UPI00221F51BE|nr:uncharacterized protein BX664DRAFT_355928 [Halteromyces radiatus]KAI8096580.1 hypothetical protein BX664DRAFT_355928 [Halteromyces radiatus]